MVPPLLDQRPIRGGHDAKPGFQQQHAEHDVVEVVNVHSQNEQSFARLQSVFALIRGRAFLAWHGGRRVLCDSQTGGLLRPLRGHADAAGHVEFSADGNLLFTADASGNLLALDPSNGRTLWHIYAGGEMRNGPITYELDGRQYVLMAVDDTLYAFALPQSAAQRSTAKNK